MTAIRQFSDRHGLAWLGALVLAVSVFVTLAFYLGWAQDLLRGEGRTVRAEFSSAPQIQPGDPVRVDGRDEGRVTSVEDRGGGRGAIVTMDVSEEAGPLYGDAGAELRWKNLLGGSFYVELDRGTPDAGDLGGRIITRDRTLVQVEVEDVTTVFRGDARTGLLTLPGEVSRGLRDPQGVADVLDAVADASPGIARTADAVVGEDEDLRRVLTGTAATMTALDAPQDGLRRLVAGAAATLGTTAARDADLRAALGDGPGVTRLVRSTLARLDTTLAGADRLVGALQPSAKDVGPVLADLRPTLTRTAALLDDARPLVRALRPAVRSLSSLGAGGVPFLDRVQPSLDRLEREILPGLAKVDPETGKPTSVMIGGTAAGFGGSASQQDANGHFIRFPASVGLSSAYLPCRSAVTDPTAGQVLACEQLDTVLTNYLGYAAPLTAGPAKTKAKATK